MESPIILLAWMLSARVCLLAWIDAVLMFLKVAYPTGSNEMREVGRAVGSDLVRAYGCTY